MQTESGDSELSQQVVLELEVHLIQDSSSCFRKSFRTFQLYLVLTVSRCHSLILQLCFLTQNPVIFILVSPFLLWHLLSERLTLMLGD